MKSLLIACLAAMVCLGVLFLAVNAKAQTGNSSTILGTVTDPSGAIVGGAVVTIHDPVSGYARSTTTDKSGDFSFSNVPFNPYHLTVAVKGFAPYTQDVNVSSVVPVHLGIKLEIASSSTTVTVQAEAGDLIETTPVAHTDIDRSLYDKLPIESQSSSVSSLVTLASPGISADSNGLFHGLGDHAENSFSVDGQPITDQQSKVFSNQIPLDSVQSMEVIEGAPPAEYGDKTSVVIDVTTRSGEGVTTPHGSVTGSYGSFGTSNAGFDLSYGGQKWGNYISANGLNTGRFLDPPEFTVLHDKGNEENFFDRADYRLSSLDSLQMNLGYTRSWFQNPNSLDSEFASPWFGVVVADNGIDPNGNLVGPTDQRSKIGTFNIAPTWTHLIGSNTVYTLGAFIRRDNYNYYPSGNPFADLGPVSLQRETVAQNRTLANAGVRTDISYVHGIHNLKAGVTYQQTFLNENDHLGIVDPTFNAPCLDANGNPVQGFSDPSQCAAAGDQANGAFDANLLPFDLTRQGGLFDFRGHTDVKELALYVQDGITLGHWNFQVGLRGDIYNGLTSQKQAEPRVGLAYNIKRTNTILRVSYARTLETPFNENLILSSVGCSSPVLNPLLACASSSLTTISPGFRNEFHAGLQQALGKYLVFDGEYIWKYTHNAYDFSVLGNTPIAFPIGWDRSKIPGYAARVSVPNYHGFTALAVFSHVAARYFTPQVGGAGEAPSGSTVFRIDHDENFNQTTHLQYQLPFKDAPWIGFNWRYDSGLVAGPVPCAGGNCANGPLGTSGAGGSDIVDLSIISADQQFQAGLSCNGVMAAPPSASNRTGTPIPNNQCLASQYGSSLITIPAPDTEDDDHNPPRIAPRNLFDLSVGDDNVLRGDRYRLSAQLTIINLTDKVALYNFLSTFSGTHYVTPRAITAQVGFHF